MTDDTQKLFIEIESRHFYELIDIIQKNARLKCRLTSKE